jgi:hypothetical protein
VITAINYAIMGHKSRAEKLYWRRINDGKVADVVS